MYKKKKKKVYIVSIFHYYSRHLFFLENKHFLVLFKQLYNTSFAHKCTIIHVVCFKQWHRANQIWKITFNLVRYIANALFFWEWCISELCCHLCIEYLYLFTVSNVIVVTCIGTTDINENEQCYMFTEVY